MAAYVGSVPVDVCMSHCSHRCTITDTLTKCNFSKHE